MQRRTQLEAEAKDRTHVRKTQRTKCITKSNRLLLPANHLTPRCSRNHWRVLVITSIHQGIKHRLRFYLHLPAMFLSLEAPHHLSHITIVLFLLISEVLLWLVQQHTKALGFEVGWWTGGMCIEQTEQRGGRRGWSHFLKNGRNRRGGAQLSAQLCILQMRKWRGRNKYAYHAETRRGLFGQHHQHFWGPITHFLLDSLFDGCNKGLHLWVAGLSFATGGTPCTRGLASCWGHCLGVCYEQTFLPLLCAHEASSAKHLRASMKAGVTVGFAQFALTGP